MYGDTVYTHTIYRQATTAGTGAAASAAAADADGTAAASSGSGDTQLSRRDLALVVAAMVCSGLLLTAAVVYVADAGRTGRSHAAPHAPEGPKRSPGATLRAQVRAAAARPHHSPLQTAAEPSDNDSLIEGGGSIAV